MEVLSEESAWVHQLTTFYLCWSLQRFAVPLGSHFLQSDPSFPDLVTEVLCGKVCLLTMMDSFEAQLKEWVCTILVVQYEFFYQLRNVNNYHIGPVTMPVNQSLFEQC